MSDDTSLLTSAVCVGFFNMEERKRVVLHVGQGAESVVLELPLNSTDDPERIARGLIARHGVPVHLLAALVSVIRTYQSQIIQVQWSQCSYCIA